MLEFYKWTCQECGGRESSLHVHHRYYKKNTNPWDYQDAAFTCLCEHCHTKVHSVMDELKKVLRGFDIKDYQLILGYAIAHHFDFSKEVDFHPASRFITVGFADYFGVPVSKVRDAIREHGGKINYSQMREIKAAENA